MSDENASQSDNTEWSNNEAQQCFNSFSKKFVCHVCDRKFVSKYNLTRHNKVYHNEDIEDDNDNESSNISNSDEENESFDDDEVMNEVSSTDGDEDINELSSTDDDEDESSTDDEEDENSTDDDEDESSTDDDEDDEMKPSHVTTMFRNMITHLYLEMEDDLGENIENYMYEDDDMSIKEAIKEAILHNDVAKKKLKQLFIRNMIDIYEQRQHPLYKAIMKRAKKRMNEGMDFCEAIAAAVSHRKHGIYNLINHI